MRKISFNSQEIQKLLPHKFPFLLLDRCVDVEPGVKGIGIKNFTINEWFFNGHFPNNPIVPGVLIIESLAQLTAIVYLAKFIIQDNKEATINTDFNKLANKVGYLVKVDLKFVSPIVPGEQMVMNTEIFKKVGMLFYAKVQAKVGNRLIAEGKLIVSEKV